MNFILQWGLRMAQIITIISIAACASNTRVKGQFDAGNPHWQGRLSLKVLSTPVQAFSADFDLQGTPQAGELTFTSPLGSTLARLQWDKSGAVLQTTGAPERFESLAALTRQATGTELPIASLFSWLQGKHLATPGWEADLQALPMGRLSAKRLGPEAPAELKIVLDQ